MILLVEDDAALRRCLIRMLEAHGRIHGVGSHGEAVSVVLSDGIIDAALLDVRLPDGSGLTLLEDIEGGARHRAVAGNLGQR